jgi:hypothetical protein
MHVECVVTEHCHQVCEVFRIGSAVVAHLSARLVCVAKPSQVWSNYCETVAQQWYQLVPVVVGLRCAVYKQQRRS